MPCPVCGGTRPVRCAEAFGIPVLVNTLHATPDAARNCARGDLLLDFCPDCGHLHNAAFDPDRVAYDGDYETSLHASSTFCTWAERLAEELIARHGLDGQTVLEIGCGRGEFLALFAGRCRPVGYDTSFAAERLPAAAGVTVHARYFDPHTDTERGRLVVSRHVLEHVAQPIPFLRLLQDAVAPDGALYVEVPSGAFLLEQLAIWDLIHEHVSYFTPASLSRALLRAGAGPQRLEVVYGEQFLASEARPFAANGAVPASPRPWLPLAERFALAYAARIAAWDERLDKAHAQGRRVALWGAGSKGATFLNLVPNGRRLDAVIDANPRKQGAHVAGTGQRILSPAEACADPIDVVLVMNPLYADEVSAELARHGSRPELLFPLIAD